MLHYTPQTCSIRNDKSRHMFIFFVGPILPKILIISNLMILLLILAHDAYLCGRIWHIDCTQLQSNTSFDCEDCKQVSVGSLFTLLGIGTDFVINLTKCGCFPFEAKYYSIIFFNDVAVAKCRLRPRIHYSTGLETGQSTQINKWP